MAMAHPEAVCIACQMAGEAIGKTIADVWSVDLKPAGKPWRYGAIAQPSDAFREGLTGAEVAGIGRAPNTVFIETGRATSLAIGYISGKVIYQEPGQARSGKPCLKVGFTDDSQLSVTVSLWGLIRVLADEDRPSFIAHWYGEGIDPGSERFTSRAFRAAIAAADDPKLSVKKFLHAFEPGYFLAGIDSGYAQEILYGAGIHPKRKLSSLTDDEISRCFDSVGQTCDAAIEAGGRITEYDLHGDPGGYTPVASRDHLGKPCPRCGAPVEQFRFEGGACYVCPRCQPLG